jgi:hypothetical protein
VALAVMLSDSIDANIKPLAGGLYGNTKLSDLSTEELRLNMNVNFESNFCKELLEFAWALDSSELTR